LSGEYTVTGEPGGSGRILMRRASASSARALLDLSLNDMTGYFDERPRITGAFVDVGDRSARAAFRGSYEGKPLAGLIVADVHGGGSHIAVLYDEPGILPSSLDRLAASADRMLPAPAQPQPQWHTVQLPDGGSMRLPEGWRVTASNKGMVDVAGPEGAGAAFGINFPVNIPGSLPPQLQAHVMVAPYIEPAAAVVGLASELARLYSPPGVTPPGPPRIIEQLPVQMPEFPQGRGAFIHFESRANNVDGHAPYRTLALVITAPTGPMTWMYYFSQIQAPEPVFRRMLPTMMEIWKNWKVSDRVLRDRLDAALGNMREIGEMARASSQAREKAMDKVHADWVEYIQGTRYERDATTGEMRIQSLHDISEIVRKKNELEGFERYQEIPLRELNQ
jgi:hypothetical protein